jgi:hypothetical protein
MLLPSHPLLGSTMTSLYALSDQAKSFGIVGGSPGDGNLLKEIEWCQSTFVEQASSGGSATTASMEPKDFDHLVSLLDTLPFGVRNAVTTKILAVSPLADRLLEQLFEYCFLPEGEDGAEDKDDDFVLI